MTHNCPEQKNRGVSVTHRAKGELTVTKYQTSKEMVQGDGYIHVAEETAGDLVQPADYQVAQSNIYI